MSTIGSTNTYSTTVDETTTDEITLDETTGSDSTSSIDATTSADGEVIVVYNNDDGSSDDSDDSNSSGDGADRNGLSFPSFSIDMKDTMLLLASLQSETAESTADFTSDQIESLTSDKFDLAAKNVDKASKARKKAKTAAFWGKVSEIAGYVGSGLVMLTAAATLNPALMVAGACMLTATVMNQTGATTDVINAMGNGNKVVGTIMLGVCIGALSLASGGAAGLTMMTTLAPAMLVTPENLEAMGVSSEAAVWISVGVGVACAVVGAVGVSKLASNATKAGSSAPGLADEAAAGANNAAALGNKTAAVGDDVLAAGNKAADSAGGAMDKLDDILDTSDDLLGAVDDTTAATSKTTNTANRSANAGDDAANAGDDAANVTEESANAGNGAAGAAGESGSTTYESLNSASKAMMEAAKETVKTTDDAATVADKIRKMAHAVAQGRLERVLNKATPNVLNYTKDATEAAKLTNAMTQINRATTGVEAVLDLATTGMDIAYAIFDRAATKLGAQADLATAQSDYASTLESMYEQQLSELSESFNSNLSTTRDSISTIDTSTRSHLQFSI